MNTSELIDYLSEEKFHLSHVNSADEWESALNYVSEQTGYPIGFDVRRYRDVDFHYLFVSGKEVHCRRNAPGDHYKVVEFSDIINGDIVFEVPDLSILFGPLAQSGRAVGS